MRYIFFLLLISGCNHMNFRKTANYVDIKKFMGKWYVIAGRFTPLEKNVYNGIEEYRYNDKKNRIDIDFSFNQNSLNGPLKKIPQKGWVVDEKTNAYWKVSPLWPLKFDYLVLDVAEDYSWTIIGVPSGKYLWIMSRQSHLSEETLTYLLNKISESGYPINSIERVTHHKNDSKD